MFLLVNRQLVVGDDDVVVFDLGAGTHTQRVVAGEIVALPHEEQSVLPRLEQLLSLISLQAAVEPTETQSLLAT